MNEEYDPMAIVEEVMGPDEDDDEGISAYALNRQRLNESRNIDPNRFKEQLDTINKFCSISVNGIPDVDFLRACLTFNLFCSVGSSLNLGNENSSSIISS